MASITLCLVTGDDSSAVEETLVNCRSAVEEIILVSIGDASDDIKEVAERNGACLYSAALGDTLGAARNLALEKTTSDWVLLMESGEKLADGSDIRRLRETVANPKSQGYALTILYGVDPETGDTTTDGHCADPRGVLAGSSVRLFRAVPEYRFGPTGDVIVPKKTEVGAVDVHINSVGFDGAAAPGEQDEVTVLNDKAVARMEAGDYEEAEKLLREAGAMVKAASPIEASILKNLAFCLIHMERSKEALKILKAATEAYSDFTDLFYIQGLAFYDLEDYMPALRNFEFCLTKGDAPPHYGGWKGVSTFRSQREMAEVFLCMNDLERAEKYFREALRSNPADGFAMEGLGEILLSKMEPDEAIGELESSADFTDLDVLRSAVDMFSRYGDKGRAAIFQRRIDAVLN